MYHRGEARAFSGLETTQMWKLSTGNHISFTLANAVWLVGATRPEGQQGVSQSQREPDSRSNPAWTREVKSSNHIDAR